MKGTVEILLSDLDELRRKSVLADELKMELSELKESKVVFSKVVDVWGSGREEAKFYYYRIPEQVGELNITLFREMEKKEEELKTEVNKLKTQKSELEDSNRFLRKKVEGLTQELRGLQKKKKRGFFEAISVR